MALRCVVGRTSSLKEAHVQKRRRKLKEVANDEAGGARIRMSRLTMVEHLVVQTEGTAKGLDLRVARVLLAGYRQRLPRPFTRA